MAQAVPIAKLQIKYMSPDNKAFYETPFYIKGNVLQTNSNASSQAAVRNKMIEKINAAINQMTSLSNNSIIESKLIYEVNLGDEF